MNEKIQKMITQLEAEIQHYTCWALDSSVDKVAMERKANACQVARDALAEAFSK